MGRHNGLASPLSLTQTWLQHHQVQGMFVIVDKEPRPDVLILPKKDEFPEWERVGGRPRK